MNHTSQLLDLKYATILISSTKYLLVYLREKLCTPSEQNEEKTFTVYAQDILVSLMSLQGKVVKWWCQLFQKYVCPFSNVI